MAEYLHYLYVEAVLGDKSCVDKIYWCLKSIERLSLSVYEDEKMERIQKYILNTSLDSSLKTTYR